MKRTIAFTIAVSLAASAGAMFAAACVGDEPGALPSQPGNDGGDQDAYRPPLGDAQTDGASSGFDPRSIGGLALWLDGNDSSSMERGSGETVTKWLDKSRAAKLHDFVSVPAEGCASPVFVPGAMNGNTKGAIFFKMDAKQCLRGPTFELSSAEGFIVYQARENPSRPDGGNMAYGLWRFGYWSVGHPSVLNNDDAQLADTFGSGGSPFFYLLPKAQWWQPRIYGVVSTQTDWFAYINGALHPATNPNEKSSFGFPTELHLGATSHGPASATNKNYFNGYIAEVLVYNRQLTDADHTTVESYLSTKWGIPVVKPDGGAL